MLSPTSTADFPPFPVEGIDLGSMTSYWPLLVFALLLLLSLAAIGMALALLNVAADLVLRLIRWLLWHPLRGPAVIATTFALAWSGLLSQEQVAAGWAVTIGVVLASLLVKVFGSSPAGRRPRPTRCKSCGGDGFEYHDNFVMNCGRCDGSGADPVY